MTSLFKISKYLDYQNTLLRLYIYVNTNINYLYLNKSEQILNFLLFILKPKVFPWHHDYLIVGLGLSLKLFQEFLRESKEFL